MKDFIRANILAVSPCNRKQSPSRQTTSTPRHGVQSNGGQARHLRLLTPRISVRSPSTPSAEHGAVETVRKELDQVNIDLIVARGELEATRKEINKQVKKYKKKVEKLEVDKNQLKLKFKKSENEKKDLKDKVKKLEKDKSEMEVKVDKLEDGRKEMSGRIESLERLFEGISLSQPEVSSKSKKATEGPGTCGACKRYFKRLDLHKKRTKNQQCKISD